MKTAVNWLVDHIYLIIPNEERKFLEGLIKEALEKEKEQFLDFLEWIEIADIKFQLNNKKIVEQYYTDLIKKI